MSDELTTFSQEMLTALEAEMKEVLNCANGRQPNLFYGMMHYHMGWADAEMKPANISGGKRIRPILCLLIAQAAGIEWQKAIPAAAAIEILHNFSLVHDDIEDASPTRRGRLTMWQIWGINQSINTGDAMFALAHLALNRLVDRGVDPAIVVQALRRFGETCVQLTYGQHLDMGFETRETVTVDEYIEMIQGKTAVLISLCTELGAMIAGKSPAAIAHYNAFGMDLGLAFQVKDDILGIWGDEELTGKSAATDIITKKKSIPVLHGLAHSPALRELYQQEETDEAFVKEAIRLLDEVGSRAFAAEKALAYSQSAIAHLEAAEPAGTAYVALQQLTHMLLERNY